ncbi:MAG: hypothetical protein Q9179_004295 [Wetmoreana sp. 5 TL-2023]
MSNQIQQTLTKGVPSDETYTTTHNSVRDTANRRKHLGSRAPNGQRVPIKVHNPSTHSTNSSGHFSETPKGGDKDIETKTGHKYKLFTTQKSTKVVTGNVGQSGDANGKARSNDYEDFKFGADNELIIGDVYDGKFSLRDWFSGKKE